MDAFDPSRVRRFYDLVADSYAIAFAGDRENDFDVAVLDRVAELRLAPGPLLDLGCGPAAVAATFLERGLTALGVDLSPGMLATARRASPQLPVAAGDMRRLPLRSGSCSVVVALYSLQHVRRGEIPEVLAEIRRVLTAAGLLLVAAHGGEGELGFDTGEFLGHQVGPSAITLYTEAELGGALRLAGFVLEETRTRGVTPGSAEVATTRHYLIARAA